MTLVAPITLALYDVGSDRRQVLIEDVRRGLAGKPKRLPSRYLYDERGCELFQAITELPEYYLTRAELALLRRHAAEIVESSRPESLVEIGAGSCQKTGILIEAARSVGWGRHFVPFDVSEEAVRAASEELVARSPGLQVYGVIGDFQKHLAALPRLGRQLVLFLGSTIGNLEPAGQAAFLRQVRALLEPGDSFLLGVDLVKDDAVLTAAYRDAGGVTAAFDRNLLVFLNRELGGDFVTEEFDYLAYYNHDRQRIEMDLRSRREQVVHLPGADLEVRFGVGECIRTEISTKFTQGAVQALLQSAGLRPGHWYTDAQEQFALALATVPDGEGRESADGGIPVA